MHIKPRIIDISKIRLIKDKLPINNISLPNFTFEHTPIESKKCRVRLYFNKSFKYKAKTDLIIYEKNMIESIFVELINEDKNTKNSIHGCIYKHPKQDTNEFTEDFINPVLY